MLELSNFQITDNSQPYEFLLTVIDDKKRSSNASVKVFVGQLPKRPGPGKIVLIEIADRNPYSPFPKFIGLKKFS